MLHLHFGLASVSVFGVSVFHCKVMYVKRRGEVGSVVCADHPKINQVVASYKGKPGIVQLLCMLSSMAQVFKSTFSESQDHITCLYKDA